MELTNHSGYPATLARAQLLYRDLMLATVVVKASFEVADDGVVRPVDAEAQLPVSEADVVTDLGSIDGDVVPIKPWCDVAVLGHALSPLAHRPVDHQVVRLGIGKFSRAVAVFGDRAWVEGVRGPKITAPVPFSSIPLTYERAFGGFARVIKKLEAPYPPNPAGRGYVKLREHLPGTLLPNIEEIDQPLSSWDAEPMPAGLAPVPRGSSLRLEGGGFGVDLENELVQLNAAAFSFAHPRMRVGNYPGGQTLVLSGASRGGSWTFSLPELTFTAALTLGDARYEMPLAVDTLCLFPDYRRVFVVARRAFVYQLLSRRPRALSVVAGPPDRGVVPTTIALQRSSASPTVSVEPAASPEALPLAFDALLRLYPITNIVEELPLCPSG